MTAMEQMGPGELTAGENRIVFRIELLIGVFGCGAAIAAALASRLDWSKGLLVGALGAWLNFRWLRAAVAKFLTLDAGASPADGGSAGGASATTLLRYALMAGAVYVSFEYLHFPLVSVVSGLCVLAPAVLTASVWEIVKPLK